MKLINTEKAGLFEATTDSFYAAGVGWNSKKWETYSWEGKNVSGILLTKVQVEYLARIESEEGVRVDYTKDQPAQEWPIPKNV